MTDMEARMAVLVALVAGAGVGAGVALAVCSHMFGSRIRTLLPPTAERRAELTRKYAPDQCPTCGATELADRRPRPDTSGSYRAGYRCGDAWHFSQGVAGAGIGAEDDAPEREPRHRMTLPPGALPADMLFRADPRDRWYDDEELDELSASRNTEGDHDN